MFIDKECRNLIVVNDGGEPTRNINQKKKSDVLQQPIDVHSVANVVGESISLCGTFIMNQLRKHDFSCDFF